MAENTSTFTGAAADGTALTAVYLTQPAANVAIGLVFAGSDLPHIVHWGRPLAKPDTLLAAYDALKPQRVSGALDDTAWPSILPTQAESWIGEQRVVLRRAGVELFPKFTVTNIEAGGVLEATLDAVSGESYTDVAGHARATGPVRVPGVIVTARDEEQGVEVEWHLELLPGGLVRQKATVTNLFGADAGAPLEIGKIELGFPLPESAGEILTTTGHHLRERSPQRQPLTVGRFEKPQLAGRPDFDASLLLTAGVPGFGFEHGDAYSVHVGWSGNSVLSAERLPYTTGVIGGGELLFGGEVTLAGPGEGQNSTTPVAVRLLWRWSQRDRRPIPLLRALPAPAPVLARPSGDPQHMGSRVLRPQLRYAEGARRQGRRLRRGTIRGGRRLVRFPPRRHLRPR